MDELLAALGYKVRASDMADVAQKLEQLEMVMGSAQEDGISHLASDTVVLQKEGADERALHSDAKMRRGRNTVRTAPREELQQVREKYVCDWILDVDNVRRDEMLQDLGLM
ncbi:hypothetical protein VIGAN_08357700 [Vigna angularis var. angularis]|uniref:Transcriptional factor DELLA N-terminal domain-containing protein n=1 Tax=Vigna angularis var. angularis TaxID=157739 RepID=A0A0S3SUZ5_PHAAN|nr:hypothetical protein VIGAN_08357700 [Vigna angularis var. angularis]